MQGGCRPKSLWSDLNRDVMKQELTIKLNQMTEEQVKKIKKMYEDYEAKFHESEKILTEAQKDSQNRNITRNDKEGNPQEIREYDAWEEAKVLGWESEAGKALREKYPRAYELFQEQQKLKQEIYEYSMKTLKVDPYNLSLKDIIEVAQAVPRDFKSKIKKK